MYIQTFSTFVFIRTITTRKVMENTFCQHVYVYTNLEIFPLFYQTHLHVKRSQYTLLSYVLSLYHANNKTILLRWSVA